MATTYLTNTYEDVSLHIIKTAASNIQLINQLNTTRKSMQNSGYYGINGGFFNPTGDNRTLNIALNNGQCVGPYLNNFMNGYGNSVGTGAIIWNGSRLSVATNVKYAEAYENAQTVWMQGGIAFWLGINDWADRFLAQDGVDSGYLTGYTKRTAMVADMNRSEVHLIVTEDLVNAASFRDAIQSYLGIHDGAQANNSYQALSLDGGGSSQMRARTSSGNIVNVTGDSRQLSQIITLKAWA